MAPARELKVSLFHINFIWFGLSFLWGWLLTVLLPLKLLSAVPQVSGGTYLTVATVAGSLTAMLWQPVAGWASDHYRSRWGRRRPFVLAGTAVAVPSLLAMSRATSPPGIAVAFLFAGLGAATAQAAAYAFIPDLVPAEERGRASAAMGAAQLAGGLLGPALAGAFAGQGRSDLAAGVIAVVLLTTVGYTALITPDPAPDGTAKDSGSSDSPGRAINAKWAVNAFRLDPLGHKGFLLALASRFLILLGFTSWSPFNQLFLKEIAGAADPSTSSALFTFAVAAGALLAVYPSGLAADRYGGKRVIYAAGIVAAAAFFLLYFLGGLRSALIFGAFAGLGYGMFLPAGWALLVDLIPGDEPARFLGLANIANVVSQLTGPAMAGLFVYRLNSLRPALGHDLLFTLVPVYIVLGLVVVKKVEIPARQK